MKGWRSQLRNTFASQNIFKLVDVWIKNVTFRLVAELLFYRL